MWFSSRFPADSHIVQRWIRLKRRAPLFVEGLLGWGVFRDARLT